MSKKQDVQKTLTGGTLGAAASNENKGGSWFERVLASEQAFGGERHIEAFKLGRATLNQDAAIRSYMWQEGKADLRGMYQWLKSRELTYYDLLRRVSP